MSATPGPWTSKGRWVGTRYHMSCIAECRDSIGNYSDDEQATSNARLIASAPHLLEACEAILKFEPSTNDNCWMDLAVAKELATKAIAKAKGEA